MSRILHIIPSLQKGGAERLVMDICQELQTRGIPVLIICFSGVNSYAEVYPEVPVKTIPASVQLSLSKKNVYNIEALQQEITRFGPDIVHTHLFEAEIVSRSCYYPQAKWFSHTHDNMPAFAEFSFKTIYSKPRFTKFYEKRYLFGRYRKNGGNTFIAISKSTFTYFKKRASEFDVILLPNAIDYNRFFQPAKVSGSSLLRLITIGSLGDNKNQAFLLDVGKVLAEQGIPFELHIVGDGPNRDILREKAQQLSFASNVFFYGSVDRVENYLKQADIYIHSAKSEALGLTIIEAMAAGLPVVTLDGKGNRDLIEEGKNGYMIYEENAHHFASKIMSVWQDKVLYETMAEYAQHFASQFDIKPYVDSLLRVYLK